MEKIYAIGMLCVLAASCLSCRKQVERIEYLPNYHQMYLFQNKSSSDYVLFRIYSSGPGGRAEDGFFVGKGYKDDSYHDVYSFDGANPFYLLPDATENYTTISNGKVYVVQRPGDAGSVYDDAFWEEAHYQFVVTDKLFENGMPL